MQAIAVDGNDGGASLAHESRDTVDESSSVIGHASMFWPLAVTALSGLVAIIASTIASVKYIRGEAAETGEKVAGRVQSVMDVHIARISTWQAGMEEWKRSFHDSIRAFSGQLSEIVARQAIIEDLARRSEDKIEAMEAQIRLMEAERKFRHERELGKGND